MTFINRLIKEAKAEPSPHELLIRPNQVRAMAEHCMGCGDISGKTREVIEDTIRLGGLRMCNVPIRVLGQ